MKKLLFLFLALFALAFANSGESGGPSEGLKANVMGMQYTKAACRIDYYTDALQHAKDTGLNVSVDATLASLNMHKSDLKTAADNVDRDAFNTAIHALKNDIHSVENIYHELKQTLKGNESRTAREEFKSFLESEKTKRNDCLSSASVGLGEAQSAYVKAWAEHVKNVSSNLHSKGMNTQAIDKIVSEAGNRASELDKAVASGNGSKVHEIVKEIREEHLHLWARFHIARLEALLDAVDDKAIAANLSEQVDEIKSILSEANAKVQPDIAYNEGEFKEVRELIKEVQSGLKDLIKDIREQNQEIRQANREQRKTEREFNRTTRKHNETEVEKEENGTEVEKNETEAENENEVKNETESENNETGSNNSGSNRGGD